MLKGIPTILSPELLKILMEMGHGDEIVLVDGNFPAASMAKRLIRLDGHDVPTVLDSILRFFPLDTFVEKPVTLMGVVPGDNYVPVIKETYRQLITKYEGEKGIEEVGRFDFYDRAKQAYAIVATGESARYANIIIKKGVIEPE